MAWHGEAGQMNSMCMKNSHSPKGRITQNFEKKMEANQLQKHQTEQVWADTHTEMALPCDSSNLVQVTLWL